MIAVAKALKSSSVINQKKQITFDPFMKKHRIDAESSKKEATSKKNPCAPTLPPTAFYFFMEVFTHGFKDNKSVAAVTKAGGEKWNSSSNLNLAVVAAENHQSESSTSTSPGSNSLSQSSGANSNDSANSLFNAIDPPEPDGVVEDQNDERTVAQSESVGRVPIKEIMPDGTKIDLCEMNLEGCQGYYSFARKLRECYVGDDLTEAEENDIIVHVLWPWHHYRTRYMVRDQHELDPRRLPWTKFSERLREIWVEKESEGSSGYSVVENNQDAASQTVFMTRIIFRDAVRPDILRDIHRRWLNSFQSFTWIVHVFWAAWLRKEPLDPEMVTELNMVVEQANPLHPSYSVKYLDESDDSVGILSIASPDELEKNLKEILEEQGLGDNEPGPEEHSDESGEEDNEEDSGDNVSGAEESDESGEEDSEEDSGYHGSGEEGSGEEDHGSGEEDNQGDDKDGEVLENEDVTDMQVRKFKRILKRKWSEGDEDEGVEGSDEEPFFVRRVVKIIILREGRVD